MSKSSIHKLCVACLHQLSFFLWSPSDCIAVLNKLLHLPQDEGQAGLNLSAARFIKSRIQIHILPVENSTVMTLRYQRIHISFLSWFTCSSVWSINESYLSGQASWQLLPLSGNLYYLWNNCNGPLSHRPTTLFFERNIRKQQEGCFWNLTLWLNNSKSL